MRHTLTLIFLFGIFTNIQSQTDYEKKGDGYLKYSNYDRALREYQKAYSKDAENITLLEKIIECMLNSNMPCEPAIPFIEKYATLKPDDPVHHYQLAVALFHSHRFDEAQEKLQQYLKLEKRKANIEKASLLDNNIATARKMTANPANVKLINLGSEINTSRDDINPYISSDGKTLFFASDERFNSYAGIYYYNIKISENNGNGWDKSKTLGGTINSLFDEKTAGFGNGELFFNHNRNKDEVLASAQYLGKGRMGMAFDLAMPFDMKGVEYSASPSITGDTIIFSGTDINNKISLFYTIKMPDNKWGEARPLPGKINSTYNDTYATYSPKGNRIYFSSNRPGGMGGYDLYYSDLNAETQEWGEAVLLPYPINDTYDNMTISFSNDMRYAYIAAVRPEGLGNRDIYQVVFENTPIPEAIFSCTLMIKGRPTDRPLSEMPQFMVFNTDGQIAAIASAKTPQSPFMVVLNPGKYKVSITSPETEPFEIDFDVPENSYSGEAAKVTFLLTPKK